MSAWIVWLVFGLVLLAMEMFHMAFVLAFFGIGALISSLIAALGVDSVAVQILVCAAIGVSGLFMFRKKLLSSLVSDDKTSGNDILDEKIMLDHDVPAQSQATITYRGVPWKALNQGESDLKKGELVKVVSIEGVKLIIDRL